MTSSLLWSIYSIVLLELELSKVWIFCVVACEVCLLQSLALLVSSVVSHMDMFGCCIAVDTALSGHVMMSCLSSMFTLVSSSGSDC